MTIGSIHQDRASENPVQRSPGGLKEVVMAGAQKRSAAVTGAGSGLGRDIALGLAAKDYRVFGTAM